MRLNLKPTFGSHFVSVHHCCWRSQLGGRAGHFCATSAVSGLVLLACNCALQGKGFASAEFVTCSTFWFQLGYAFALLLLSSGDLYQEMNACTSC